MPLSDELHDLFGQVVADAATEAVMPEFDEFRSADNPVRVVLDDLALRPGARRRVALRAVPGTVVEVGARAIEWLPVDILDAPRHAIGDSPGGGAGPSRGTNLAPDATVLAGTSSAPSPAIAPAGGSAPNVGPNASAGAGTAPVVGPAAHPAVRAGTGGGDLNPELLAKLSAPGGFGPHSGFGDIGPILPDDPLRPQPVAPVPIDVVVSARSGREFAHETLQPSASGQAPARITVDGIDVNEVIDITFVNPNPFAVIVPTCFVHAIRTVETEVVTFPSSLLTTAFNDALRSLTPEVSLIDGEARLAFDGPLADELDLTSITADLPGSFDGGATFSPGEIEILSHHELLRRVIAKFVPDLTTRLAGAASVMTSPDRETLSDHIASDLTIEALTEPIGTEYFSQTLPDVAGVLKQLAVPSSISNLRKAAVEANVDTVLTGYPLLTDEHSHRPGDVGLAASYRLSEIHGELGPLTLELNRVEASVFIALNHARRKVDAPFGDLPLDLLTIGTIRPTIHFDLVIGDLDINIDVPVAVAVATVGVASLGAWLLEQGGEALFDYIADKAEDDVPNEVHELFASHADTIGELVAQGFGTIADRSKYFHSAAASSSQMAIATIDPGQLNVPHDPDHRRRPSPIAGIDDTVSPVDPIDHDAALTPAAIIGPTPEQRLNQIEHFVFVMMENRSFDHMLGHLSHPDFGARSDVDGLDGSARELGGDLAGTLATPLPAPNPQFRPNLPHDDVSIALQINNGEMNGFASEYGRKLGRARGVDPKGFLNDAQRALRFQTPDIVETYDRLAREYTICDRWFSSVPAGTFPNRSCYYTGVTPSLSNDGIFEDAGYLDQLTVFDVLDHVGVEWKVFESNVTFLRMFDRFRLDTERIRPLSEISDPLPAVTFIDPSFTGYPITEGNNDDQPPTDVRDGQAFVDDIVNRVQEMGAWESTMIVVTYDEHGGFADHVAPPGAPGSSHPPESGAIAPSHPDADTFGVRVPTFVVSPLVDAGRVEHKIFDHCTVFRTLLQRFAPQHVNSAIVPERVRRARHLGEVLSDQPPRVSTPAIDVPTSPVVVSAPALGEPRGRFTFDDLDDPEDMTAALKAIGKPSPTRGIYSRGR